MKMKMNGKRQGTTGIPGFAVGALAMAGASTATGATVQITFTDSFVSSSSGNQLNADFGGDGVSDLYVSYFAGANASFFGMRIGKSGFFPRAQAFGNVVYGNAVAYARFTTSAGRYERLAVYNDIETVSVKGVVPISFVDGNIRGGESTIGYLDVIATASALGDKRVEIRRLIFDDDTGGTIAGLNVNDPAFPEFAAVPEPSSLGLLALGAGGLLARRRREKAAA